MGNKYIIEFKNISKSYGIHEVLSNISFGIYAGEFITIIGSSGSGKTTILKMINGLIKEESGKILINGCEIENINLISLRRNIGYSIQSIGLFPHMTIRDNIMYVLSLSNTFKKRDGNLRVLELIKMLELDESLLHRYPSELSGGQKQRVGIARALASNPSILLMDEPFGAVDEITRAKLQKQIANIHEQLGTTILFVTHDINEATMLGTRIMILNKGKIEQFDSYKKIKESPSSDYVKVLLG